MSPSAPQGSRAPKPKPKSGERKSVTQKAAPSVKKTKTATPPPAIERVKPAKPAATRAAAPAVPAKRRTPDEAAVPAKKDRVMKAEEPKKKLPKTTAPKAAAPQPEEPVAPRKHAVKANEVELPPKKAAKSAPKADSGIPPVAPRRGRKPKGEAPLEDDLDSPRPRSAARAKPFDPTEEFLDDDLPIEDDDALGEEIELDPLEIPLELLDPELVEVPRPTSPKPKPKPVKTERRPQVCAGCGNPYTWLSVEQLCFSCLKKKLAQRKREDESYGGFSGEVEEEEDNS